MDIVLSDMLVGAKRQQLREKKGTAKSKSQHQPAATGKSKGLQLDRKLLIRGISKASLGNKSRDRLEEHFGKVSHLHLQEKNIEFIPEDIFAPFRSLTCLYLYGNRLKIIQGLENLPHLTSLYLNDNLILNIDGLSECPKLQKISLSFNEIEIIEGLEKLYYLNEFFIDNQRISNNQSIIFTPETLENLSDNLVFLDISGNQLRSLEPVQNMQKLEVLYARDNLISNLDETVEFLTAIPCLTVIDLVKNPVTNAPKYKEKMIGLLHRLEFLDGKEIQDNTRVFMQRFCLMKAIRNDIHNNKKKHVSTTDSSADFSESKTLLMESTEKSKGDIMSTHPLNTPQGSGMLTPTSTEDEAVEKLHGGSRSGDCPTTDSSGPNSTFTLNSALPLCSSNLSLSVKPPKRTKSKRTRSNICQISKISDVNWEGQNSNDDAYNFPVPVMKESRPLTPIELAFCETPGDIAN